MAILQAIALISTIVAYLAITVDIVWKIWRKNATKKEGDHLSNR